MVRGSEHEPRKTAEYITGRRDFQQPPVKEAPVLKGIDELHDLSQRRREKLTEIANNIAREIESDTPLERLQGTRLAEFRALQQGAVTDDELAYLVYMLRDCGLDVKWSGTEYIAYRKEEEDEDDEA